MTAFLNIALLIVGTAATLCAFGGKTWREGPQPILERVNSRGWISLMCLVLALAIGTLKELRTQREDARKDKAATAEKAEAARKQAEQSAELAKSRSQLTLANKSLEDLQKIDIITQDRLSETKATLEDVRGNLGKTQDELDRQGHVGLLTALANSDQRVKDIQFFVPFTDKATKSPTFHGALLPEFSSSTCRAGTQVDVALSLGKGGPEIMEYRPDDDKDQHSYFDNSPPKVDRLFHPTDTDDMMDTDMTRLILLGQKTSNLHAFAVVIHVLQQHESAAHFLYPLQIFSGYPITIIADTPEKNVVVETDDNILLKKNSAYSALCEEQVRRYFGAAFEKAYVGITLSQKQNLAIYFRLKALKPTKHLGAWTVSFAIDSKPLVFVNDEFAGLFNVEWPDNRDKSNDTTH